MPTFHTVFSAESVPTMTGGSSTDGLNCFYPGELMSGNPPSLVPHLVSWTVGSIVVNGFLQNSGGILVSLAIIFSSYSALISDLGCFQVFSQQTSR